MSSPTACRLTLPTFAVLSKRPTRIFSRRSASIPQVTPAPAGLACPSSLRQRNGAGSTGKSPENERSMLRFGRHSVLSARVLARKPLFGVTRRSAGSAHHLEHRPPTPNTGAGEPTHRPSPSTERPSSGDRQSARGRHHAMGVVGPPPQACPCVAVRTVHVNSLKDAFDQMSVRAQKQMFSSSHPCVVARHHVCRSALYPLIVSRHA